MARRFTVVVAMAQLLCAAAAWADIATARLEIQGAGLRVETVAVTTGADIPTTIQTSFAGRTNDDAPAVTGLLAVGELTGPGIDTPIQLTATPGYRFHIPGLPRLGDYYLQNVRLMSGNEVIQHATPSLAKITVADLLQTSLAVKQLSPEEIRARGIVTDARNYDVYEYSFTFLVNGEQVVVPFPVIVDRRTHVVTPVKVETDYGMPPATKNVQPPRWTPPDIVPFEFPDAPEAPPQPGAPPRQRINRPPRPRIPAALVIPNSLAVLHQFFAVALTVTNGAPTGSTARLEDIGATLKIKNLAALRAVKSTPQVGFGQAVPVVDPNTGVTVLLAQSKGEAEWVLEGLTPGTHTVEVDIRATLRQEGQEDVSLRAAPSTAVIIHDPRFNITFSHPDTVRKGLDYSTFAFVTNMSPQTQTLRVSDGLPQCTAEQTPNVCRVSGGPPAADMTIGPGQMRVVEYRLRSGETGQVYATAGSVSSDAIAAAVQLHMGVSTTGIPLSPATLVLPHYAQYIHPDLVASYLELLGLGYSLATAPLNQVTARFPRVIKTDVFYRANDIARAGQRTFIGDTSADAKRDALSNLFLDLLGNSIELREWDDLRRAESAGRRGGAAVMKELRAALIDGKSSISGVIDEFAADTAHRGGFVLAIAHAAEGAARPLAIELRGVSGRSAAIANEAESGWKRDLAFADVSRFDAFGRAGELAVAGRWTEDLELLITPAVTGPFEIELLFPGSTEGTTMRAHLEAQGTANETLRVPITRGASGVNVLLPNGGFAANASASQVPPAALTILGARQDLRLDREGHKVSLLFSRPVAVAGGTDILTKFAGAIDFNRDGVTFTDSRAIFAAALQHDQRVVNLSFDHVLSTNASYTIAVSPMIDPASGGSVSFAPVVPKIDNDRPAGILYGKFITGDNKPIPDAEVRFFTGHWVGCNRDGQAPEAQVVCNPFREAPQFARTRGDGAFLFEYVPRDVIADPGLTGAYKAVGVTPEGKATAVEGAVRLPGKVHIVNLQLLGRGSAEGRVRYDNGQVAAGVRVHVSSTMFKIGRDAVTDATGFFRVEDLAVGPITFGVVDDDGNSAFASGEIATPGSVAIKELVIYRKPFPGTGTVYGRITRSDNGEPVFGARVGVYSQGYGFAETTTASDGSYEFSKVPAGFVTVLAAEWSVSRENAAADFDLRPDETKEMNLALQVTPDDMKFVRVTGRVLRENPLFPGDPAKYERVAGAVVNLAILGTTADANGEFVFDGVPIIASDRTMRAYDPATKRYASATVPTLSEAGPNDVTVFIPAHSYGGGTIRVRVISASGVPVDGFRVIEPGYPAKVLTRIGAGVYEYRDAPVGTTVEIFAVDGPVAYGEQVGRGKIKLDFAGQTATLVLRLPGQGTVRAKLRSDFDLISDVLLTYNVWNDAEQAMVPHSFTQSSSENGVAGYATFTGVPALQSYTVSSAHQVYGYAEGKGKLAFDGDLMLHTLQLNKLATVRGTVYAIDGVTPISGATVRLYDGRRDAGIVYTQPDGTFVFHDVPAGVSFHVTAQVTQSGIYRVGIAYGKTPDLGGPARETAVILRRRGSVEGRVVYADYKVYDAEDPSKRVADDTPGDYSDNAPVPLARLWLRELDYPDRSFGGNSDPLVADIGGRFAVNNVFIGSLRAMAWSAENQELRGNWTGELTDEGELLTGVYIAIGGGGTGSVQVKVVDPNQQYLPIANSEVRIYRSGRLFDLASTDDAGLARFDELPTGTYSTSAYSKALGKSGSGGSFSITRDQLTELRILLEFVGKVDGRLSDPMFSPSKALTGVAVKLTASSFYAISTTDGQGLFYFEGIREGDFVLEAKDTASNRWARGQGEITAANRRPYIELELEKTESLHVAVYLPDDTGANSGTLAGAFDVDVVQRCSGSVCDYRRTLQGNSLTFPNLFINRRYGDAEKYYVTARELGGAARTLKAENVFPKGTAADPLKLVYPAFGGLEVSVIQAGGPAQGARVEMSQGSERRVLYTDAAGKASARGFLLGSVSVQVRSVDGRFTGSTTVTIARQSVIATGTIELGAYAGVSGLVDAETGGPSIGTRVVATFSGRTLEMVTDAEGGYLFQGIPTSASGTLVSLSYVGPDGVTIGARQTTSVNHDWASQVRPLTKVKLDATPPQLLTIAPADGAQNVSPDSQVRLIFSERIDSADLTSGNLQLIAADGSGQVSCAITSALEADGTFSVTLKPNPKAGQTYPLKSNTLYRIVVSSNLNDLTGHRLPSSRGSIFTTSDYAEPRVLRLEPSDKLPLPAQATLQYHFNEPIDPQGITFRFYKLSSAGAGGAVVAEKTGRAYVDPASSLYLAFAPDAEIEPESYYRAVFSGVRDLQGNALGTQTYHYFSFDRSKPYLRMVSPVPDGIALVSGVQYTLNVDPRNDSLDGTAATDVAKVEYLRVDGASETFLTTATVAPFSYRFSAPEAAEAGMTYTIRAIATDLSGNAGPPSTISWTVKPNAAPKDVNVTLSATSAYPGATVTANVTFDDEGVLAPVQVVARGSNGDGTEYVESKTTEAKRSSVGQAWPAVALSFKVPLTVKAETNTSFTATVTDVRGLSATSSASLAVLADAIKPTIVSTTPAAETSYTLNAKYKVTAVVSDAETGVAEVQFLVDGTTHRVLAAASTAGPAAGTRTFTSPQITATARNVDTRIPIVVRVLDYHGNLTTRSFEVIYVGVNDPTAPKGSWLCPIDRAVLPASQTAYKLPLKVLAQDDVAITSVKFRVPGIADPVTATRIGTTDDYEALITLDTPAAGSDFTVAAIISDADETHTIELPIAIDVVAFDRTIDATEAVDADTVHLYEGKSLIVRGAGRLLVNVPLALRNVAVLDGGRLETLGTTTSRERKLDLTVTDHVFVDCTSFIDVTAKGYLGGWGLNPDGTNTRNESATGRTTGNVTAGGAMSAAASHGGYGGQNGTGATNTPYGSITDPFDLGSGGAGHPTSNSNPGGTGGGAISLRVSSAADAVARVVIAGTVRADAASAGRHGGAGGSIRVNARQLVIGPRASISANGGRGQSGCGSDSDQCHGGSGGRIAITAGERLDLAARIRAYGGAVGSGGTMLGGAAGTVYVRRPGQTDGELHIAQTDTAATASYTRSTPLSAGTFDRIVLGPWALLRIDGAFTVAAPIEQDPTAVVADLDDVPTLAATTAPATGATLIRYTPLEALLDLGSAAGVVTAELDFSATPPKKVSTFSNPLSVDDHRVTWTVAADAPLGAATLKVKVTDRADRVTEQTIAAFTVIDNTAPVIDAFTALPASVYPGAIVTAKISATDDVSVTRVAATAQIGASTPSTQTRNTNAKTVTNETFAFTVPVTTAGGTPMTVEASVEDGFPGRVATKQLANITILDDTIAPVITINSPTDAQQFDEAAATFAINVTATDAEVRVKTVTAKVGEGSDVSLTGNAAATTWTGTLGIPPVDGEEIVTFPVSVTATDYAGNTKTATINIKVKPTIDPNAPALKWICGREAKLLAGAATKLRVEAIAANGSNPVQKVEFFVDSQPAIAATSIGSNLWEATWNVPAGAATYLVDAVATASGGATRSVKTTVIAVVPDQVFSANATIAASDLTYENKVVAVTAGTLTIGGAHTFADLLVLGGMVTHPTGDASFRLTTGTVHVGCDGTIDATGRGYAANTSGAALPGNNSGGSHLGVGGIATSPGGAGFGSVYRPQEFGGGARGTQAAAGGGVIMIDAQTVTVDGAIYSNGAQSRATGAGGSIWIRTARIGGSGKIHANAGTSTDASSTVYGGGGGGAIAVEYTDASSVLPAMRATGNTSDRIGGAGTVYVKGPSSTWGTLTIDNGNRDGAATELPSLGGGTAQAGSSGTTLVTDRATDIPAYFAGHWIEIEGKGTWRIESVSAKTATLAAGANVAPGDTWQGVYRFDDVVIKGQHVITSRDPIRLPAGAIFTIDGPAVSGEWITFTEPLAAETIVLKGNVQALNNITADNLTVSATAVLSGGSSLRLEARNLTVAGIVGASGSGYAANTTYSGTTLPGSNSGGSHLGVGGISTAPGGATYGSVYRPQEFGAGGRHSSGGRGGGIISIEAATLSVDGTIRTNGAQADAAGAGGSIWIRTAKITGTGTIESNGGASVEGSSTVYGGGGGGAIALEYTDATSTLPVLRALGGSGNRDGGAGTVYVKGPVTAYGELFIDNGDQTGAPTELPSLGSGTAQAGSGGVTLVTDRATDIPAYFAGHWIEIEGKGTWRVESVSAKTMTLESGANVAAGDKWQGVYRFDNVHITGRNVVTSRDPIRLSPGAVLTLDGPAIGGEYLTLTEPLVAESVVIKDHVQLAEVTAGDLTVASGGLLVCIGTSPLTIDAKNLTVNGSINTGGRGFTANTAYSGASLPGANSGGSHHGTGGISTAPGGATFGSVYRPQEAGGGGRHSSGSAGGGVITINAEAIAVNGSITAVGAQSDDAAGAGGSIWIRTAKISGSGTIDANGGASVEGSSTVYGGGGGGAVAIEYTDATSTLPVLRALGGAGNRIGGAGTIYVKGPASTFGNLTIDNGTQSGAATDLPSLGAGIALAGSSGTTLVTDSATNIPAYFAGHWVRVEGKGTWRIESVDAKTITLSTGASVAPGDEWIGVHRFDTLTLRRSTVTSGDPIEYATLDSATSTLSFNDGRPRFPAFTRAQIVVASSGDSDSITAPAGAVADANTPIKLTATNTRTGATFLANAAADGSFTIPVTGLPGDTFSLVATDSYAKPLSSLPIDVSGSIVNVNDILSLTIDPSSVNGGQQATGTVRLAYPAKGALTVGLSSSDATAVVPGSVSIAAGLSSAQFVIATTSPASTVAATITATYTSSKSATLTIVPSSSSLVSLTIDAASIEGGQSTNGRALLGAPAPAGGATVILGSSDTTVATVPASVTIAAGSTEGTFTVATARTGSSVTAAITGSYGESRSATLTVTACASMSGTASPPASVALNNVWIDDDVALPATSAGGTFTTAQAASGTKSVLVTATANTPQHWMVDGLSKNVTAADSLVVHALIDPCNPPREIVLTFEQGATEYRALWGETQIDAAKAGIHAGAVPTGGEWTRLSVPVKALGIATAQAITGITVSIYGGEAWFDRIGTASCSLATASAPSTFPAADDVWFDDALPANATVFGTWSWASTQRASGTSSLNGPLAAGMHDYSFRNTTETIALRSGDVLFAHVLVDPCNPPRQIALAWHDGASWDYPAYWGEDLITTGGYASANRKRIGPLPRSGEWVRLEVPASVLGLEGKTAGGMAFALYDGQAWFDRAGRAARVNVANGKTTTSSASALDIDLASIQPIESIDVRGTLDNFRVLVSDLPFAADPLTQSGVSNFHYSGSTTAAFFDVHRTGRYVRVPSGAEVAVWAPVGAGRVNHAGGGAASSSTSASPASNAVNGISRGDLFATNSEVEPRWDLDLGSVQSISSITITESANYYVLVSTTPFASSSLATTIADPNVSVWYYAGSRPATSVPVHRQGRYVRVQKAGPTASTLSFAEIQVWSQPLALWPLAKGARAE